MVVYFGLTFIRREKIGKLSIFLLNVAWKCFGSLFPAHNKKGNRAQILAPPITLLLSVG